MAAFVMDCGARCVELGFLEKCESWAVKSKYFPSKVGGKPAWLHLTGIPDGTRLSCNNCGEPCIFLLQVYAPIDEDAAAFHRTVFVFTCVNAECVKHNTTGSVIALRSQLPRINTFYGENPSPETPCGSDTPSACEHNNLCVVCGALGNKCCGRCRSRHYCTKSHQVWDWKHGHKSRCGLAASDNLTDGTNAVILFPEYELVTEPEDDGYEDPSSDRTDEERFSDYREFLSKHPENTALGSCPTDLDKMATSCKDKAFWKFKKVTEKFPDQVLRYDIGGSPLFVSSEGIPDDIPNCPCGSVRQFEFQVLPQLLNSIVESSSESLDWGTLLVYTCKRSCDTNEAYHSEFVWKQEFSKEE